jgi:hypothetical protein
LCISHSEQVPRISILPFGNRIEEGRRELCNDASGQPANSDPSLVCGSHGSFKLLESPTGSSFHDSGGISFDSPDTVIGSMYHSGRFKCLHPGCARKSFGRQAELKRHHETIHATQKPAYWCRVPSCERSRARGGYPFTRRDKLNDHVRAMHAQANLTAPTSIVRY